MNARLHDGGRVRRSAFHPRVFAGLVAALVALSFVNRDTTQRRFGTPISAGAVAAVMVWLIVGPAFLFALRQVVLALAERDFGAALIALGLTVVMGIVLFPWPIVRTLLIPRGSVKLSWALARSSFWVWRRDVRGGAVLAASWAALRRAQSDPSASLDPELIAWIERRRDAPSSSMRRWKLGGATIVATGLLAELNGDRASARRLLSSATELARPTSPLHAIEIASEWLCAEAMERGSWRELKSLARTFPITTRRLRLFGGVAARLTGTAPLPSDRRLVWQWLVAPNRRATRELLDRALASPTKLEDRSASTRRNVAPPALPKHDALRSALLLHAFTLARDPTKLERDDLSLLARAWDQALADPALERRLLERGLALGTHEHDRNPSRLRAIVRGDLLALVRAAGLELAQFNDASELLARAARELHGELLDGLEIATAALESRVEAKRELPAVDEWQTFLALREQYTAAVGLGGLALRRLAFQDIYVPVCSLAVWLWNERSERALGNAIFKWLLDEAIIVDDAEAVRLQERNVDCGV